MLKVESEGLRVYGVGLKLRVQGLGLRERGGIWGEGFGRFGVKGLADLGLRVWHLHLSCVPENRCKVEG